MAGARIVKWNGQQIAKQMREAEMAAVQETIDAAAQAAAGMRSGTRADITTERAEDTGSGAAGRWGNFPEPGGDPFYELFAETGTAFQSGDNAKRRAADQEYPQLVSRIRSHRGG